MNENTNQSVNIFGFENKTNAQAKSALTHGVPSSAPKTRLAHSKNTNTRITLHGGFTQRTASHTYDINLQDVIIEHTSGSLLLVNSSLSHLLPSNNPT